MAAPERQSDEPARQGIREALQQTPVAKVLGIVTSEPHLKAAFRQGIDEIGDALKAFPDSIQKTEIGGLFTPTPAEVAQEHGVFGSTLEQSEGMAMNQHNPVTAALDASRPGQPQTDRRTVQQPERGPTGDRSATVPPREQQQSQEAEQAAPDRNPVEQALDVARDEAIQPQITPMEQSMEQDLSRGR